MIANKEKREKNKTQNLGPVDEAVPPVAEAEPPVAEKTNVKQDPVFQLFFC